MSITATSSSLKMSETRRSKLRMRVSRAVASESIADEPMLPSATFCTALYTVGHQVCEILCATPPSSVDGDAAA